MAQTRKRRRVRGRKDKLPNQNTTPKDSTPKPKRVRTPGPRKVDPNYPQYELSLEVKTIEDLWQEYSVGWKGGPAVKELNDKYESR